MIRDSLGRLIKGWNGTENIRFTTKINKTEDCWYWTGAMLKNGYGSFWYNNKAGYAHRYAYEQYKGSIPLDKEIDHLCRIRNCVNPNHLEAVTRQINTKRGKAGEVLRLRQLSKTHCPKGHEYAGNNIYRNPKHPDRRDCRTCRTEASRRHRHKEAIDELV